jgi:hypothetical protein
MKGEDEEPLLLSDTEYLDELDKIIEALRVKMHQLEMKCENDRLVVQNFAQQKAKLQALNAMKLMNQKKKTLEQWNAIYLKLNQIRHTMETMSITQDLATQFKKANDILKYATKKLDVGALEEMMDDIGESMDVVREVDDLLAKPVREIEVDEEEMYKEITSIFINSEERGVNQQPPKTKKEKKNLLLSN